MSSPEEFGDTYYDSDTFEWRRGNDRGRSPARRPRGEVAARRRAERRRNGGNQVWNNSQRYEQTATRTRAAVGEYGGGGGCPNPEIEVMWKQTMQ